METIDVLIIGGYSLTDLSGKSDDESNKTHMSYKNITATIEFLKLLHETNGDLDKTEKAILAKDMTKYINRSLNVIYLYDLLAKNGYKVGALNYFFLEKEKFSRLISLKPKVIVLSTTYIEDINEIEIMTRAIKNILPDSIIIAGGIKVIKSHKIFSLYKDNYFKGYDDEQMIGNNFFFSNKKSEFIDLFVVDDHGGKTLLTLMSKILAKTEYKDTPNIAFYQDGRFVYTRTEKEIFDFESNIISWKNIPADIVGNEIPVQAGIGCPYPCQYCDFTGLHKDIVIRDISNIMAELKNIQEVFPHKQIFFTDDNLFVNKKRVREFSEAIIKNNIKIRWRAFFRADSISQENVEALAKSGCTGCFLGVESGSEKILLNMKKNLKPDQIIDSVRLLNQYGINTLSTIIIGFPGETEETLRDTVRLLNSYPDMENTLNLYQPFVFRFVPLAPIASPENRLAYGLKGNETKWEHSTMNSEQAEKWIPKLFKEVSTPFLIYPEFLGNLGLPISQIKMAMKLREHLVKAGQSRVDASHVREMIRIFQPVFSK